MRRNTIGLVLLMAAHAAVAANQPSVQVRTAKVVQHKLNETITGFGTVQPAPEAQTTQDAVYKALVERIDVALGQPVQKGDALIKLRTAPSARANYLSARAKVHYARQALTRKRKLLDQQLATHADVDAARQTLATAKAAFAAQQALGTGEKTQTIKAPFTGIVSQLPVQSGAMVTTGTPLFQLARRDHLQAALGIEPDEVGRIKRGLPVKVGALFAGGDEVVSRVQQVNAVVDPSTRLVNVIVALQGDRAAPFLPGMRVKGTLTLVAHTKLAVPRSAVLHDGQGDYLFLVRQGKAHRIEIHTGIEHNGLIGVSGDLKAGQRIVVQGNYELADGMAVR